VSEAHDPERKMFGVDRLAALVGRAPIGEDLIDACLAELAEFTGNVDEQEDDITLVTLARGDAAPIQPEVDTDVLLDAFESPSPPGNERAAMARVRALLENELDGAALDRLGTAVAETVVNAAEHGNGGSADIPVEVAVFRTAAGFRVDVTDSARTERRVEPNADAPDIDLKLAGLQSPRGWRLFLVRSMVDDVEERTSASLSPLRPVCSSPPAFSSCTPTTSRSRS
jgi:anti-sigma regulatory factor (Ser/Thr protein kinase)